ncbi:hypothetical protein H0H93_007843 [Arthromyces matolae]|nr:hypothetical protein H0H93_007843 [Arthromyces matolae]
MLRLGLISALTLVVFACDHGHKHDHSIRSYAPPWVTPPPNDLVWGDINIIHTTDSHGWLQGHQKSTFPEPNYSGDFGDFAQFVTRMKQIAANKQVDLLLVDSGDLHDGSGLTDAFPPDSVDGHDANEIFALLPYDLLTIGNPVQKVHDRAIYE